MPIWRQVWRRSGASSPANHRLPGDLSPGSCCFFVAFLWWNVAAGRNRWILCLGEDIFLRHGAGYLSLLLRAPYGISWLDEGAETRDPARLIGLNIPGRRGLVFHFSFEAQFFTSVVSRAGILCRRDNESVLRATCGAL